MTARAHRGKTFKTEKAANQVAAQPTSDPCTIHHFAAAPLEHPDLDRTPAALHFFNYDMKYISLIGDVGGRTCGYRG